MPSKAAHALPYWEAGESEEAIGEDASVQRSGRAGSDPSHWIWNRGIAAGCDVRIPDEFPDGLTYTRVPTLAGDNVFHAPETETVIDLGPFETLEPGALVWVRGAWLPAFVEHVLPRLTTPIVLVTGDTDSSLPSAAADVGRAVIESPLVLHWYTQNFDGTAPERVSPIPIGLDLHTLWDEPGAGARMSAQHQEAELDAIVRSLPPLVERIPRIYVDFSWANSDTPAPFGARLTETRPEIVQLLAANPLVVHQEHPLPRSEMWRCKGQYAFSLSPHGHGLDCHRTWESLILGQVVLVPSSPLDPLFEGLAAFALRSWSDITLDNVVRWLAKATKIDEPHARLTNDSWLTRMRDHAAGYS